MNQIKRIMSSLTIKDRPIKLLSQAYQENSPTTFAVCSHCHAVFQDDVPNYGSLICPYCNWALRRGLKEDEIASLITANDRSLALCKRSKLCQF